MKETLYLTDLDGTLLNSRCQISDYSITIINNFIKQGGLFSYATARSFSSASKITCKLNLRIPIATYNGAFLVDHTNGKILEACLLDEEQAESIYTAIVEHGVYPLVYAFVNNEERVSWIDSKKNSGIINYLNSRKGDKRLRPVASYNELFYGDIFYITLIGAKSETNAISYLFDNNKHICYHIQEDIYTNEYWLEIFRHDATKEQAALKLKTLTAADMIISFGDNINDIPMFRASDECYAVNNAKDALKEISTAVIGSNNDDGVAAFLDKQK